MARILIVVEGGLVQGVCSDDADVELVVWDIDNIKAGDDEPDVDWAKRIMDKDLQLSFDWIY